MADKPVGDWDSCILSLCGRVAHSRVKPPKAQDTWYVYTNVHLRHYAPLAAPRSVSVGPHGQCR
eukprot:6836145-Prymnesium_polylepis.1